MKIRKARGSLEGAKLPVLGRPTPAERAALAPFVMLVPTPHRVIDTAVTRGRLGQCETLGSGRRSAQRAVVLGRAACRVDLLVREGLPWPGQRGAVGQQRSGLGLGLGAVRKGRRCWCRRRLVGDVGVDALVCFG